MGVVYLATDQLLDREVAIKFMSSSAWNSGAQERFQREARIVAKMDHPSIVSLFDIGKHEDSLYIVMPFVPGASLRSRMDEQTLRIRDVIELGIQIADAIDYSHASGVIHRDIKPENVLIQEETLQSIRVRVTDFGLARSTSDRRLTQSGSLVGTVEYLSPEQVMDGEVDGRSDIYSLGTVLYECLVGNTPFTGEVYTVIYRLAHDQPTAPRALGMSIPEPLEDLILQCLEKDPVNRPQKASELEQRLIQLRMEIHEGETLCVDLRKRGKVFRSSARATTEPIIGRTAQLNELMQRLNAASSGECHFALVTGEAGVGKSRLLQELENLARARKINILHGRFSDLYQNFPYHAFGELIRDFLQARRSSEQLPDLSDLISDLFALFPMLSEFEIFKVSSPQMAPSKFEDRFNIFELLSRTISRMSEGKTILLVLEDLHAGSASLEALHYILRRLSATPVMIVAAARTTELEKDHPLFEMIRALEGDHSFLHITLGPLPMKEYESLVHYYCGNMSMEPDFVKRIHEATDGNPYFTKELLQSFRDSNTQSIRQLADSGELPTMPLPSTIQQVVSRRVERLPERSRQLLAVGSVLGRSFDYMDLEALAGNEAEELVDSLVKSGLLEEDRESRGERLAFSSGLLREVLYASLPPRKRRSYHLKFAENLEKRYGSRPERIYPELIHHYSQANVREKVFEYGLKFAHRSLSTFSEQDAFRAAQTVLRFIKEADTHDIQLELDTRKVLAECHRMAGRWDAAIQESEEIIQLFSRVKDTKRMLEAILFLVETSWLGRKLDTMRSWTGRGIEMGRASGEIAILERLLPLAATAAQLRCDYDKAQDYISELESLRRRNAEEEPEEIAAGGTLMVGLSAPVQAQHPAEIHVDEENEILGNIFETLVTTDPHGNLIPLVCSRWEPLNEGRAFLFTIHEDIRIHGGLTLTAARIKSAWEESIRKIDQSLPAAFAAIEGVTEFLNGSATEVSGIIAFSEWKLAIQMKKQLPIYPSMLSDTRTAIAVVQDNEVAGTGPFEISSFTKSHVILQRYDPYWRSKALLDRIDYKCSQTSRDIAEGFRSGRFDLVRDLSAQDLDEILKERCAVSRFSEAARKNIYYALFNQNSKSLRSLEIRRGLTASIRTQDLARTTLGRSVQPAESLIPPGMFCYDPSRRRNILSVDSVRESLPAGLQLNAAVHPLFQDHYASLTKALLQFWSDLGVKVTIVTSDISSYLSCLAKSDGYDLILGRWIADYDDPDSFAFGLFDSSQGSLKNFFSSALFDEMIRDARTETSPERRDILYRKIEDYLEESGFFLPLFHEVSYRICSSNVRRLRLRNSPPYVNYSEIGKLEKAPEIATDKMYRGVVQVPVARRLFSLDPSLAFLEATGEVLPSVFETLIRYEEGARLVPWLAAEYVPDNSGRQFHFRLRDNVTFHNGRTFSARDVRYSFERLLKNPKSKTRNILLPIRGAASVRDGKKQSLEGFKILSPLEFVIELEYPLSFFPAVLTFPATAVIAEGSDPEQSNWQDGCVGTGPFRVGRFDAGERAVLESNPTYWRKGYPKSEGITFTFGLSPGEIFSGFKNRRFSLAADLLPEDVESLRKESEYASLYRETPRLSTEYIAFNIHRPPLDSEQIRQQLARAVDSRLLVKRKLGRLGIPADGILPPGLLGHESMESTRSSSPSVFPHLGIRLTACISPRHQGRYAGLAEEVFQIWEKMGVQIQVLHPTEVEYAQILSSPEVNLSVTGWTADYPDPDTFVDGALHSEHGADGKFCGLKELDHLTIRARAEQNPDLRHDIYRQIEKIIAQKAILIPLFHEQTYRFANPQLQNLKLNLFFPVVDYENLWVE